MLLLFGCIPALILFLVFYIQKSELHNQITNYLEGMSLSLSTQISQAIEQKYRDMKGLVFNKEITDVSKWGNFEDSAALTNLLNKYVENYWMTKLVIIVDRKGQIQAINNRDPHGKSLDVASLTKTDLNSQWWYKQLLTSIKQNDLRGLLNRPVHLSSIDKLYGQDDTYVLLFITHLYDDHNNYVADLITFVDFSSIEWVVTRFHKDAAQPNLPNTEITLIDQYGNIIMDFDPHQSAKHYARNFNLLGQYNLLDHESLAAIKTVQGETGVVESFHSRKKVYLTNAFTSLRDLQTVKMPKWGVLVRIPPAIAFSALNKIQFLMVFSIILTIVIILLLGTIIGHKVTQPFNHLSSAIRRLAKGDTHPEIPYQHRSDELGETARAIQNFKETRLELDKFAHIRVSEAESHRQHYRMLLLNLTDKLYYELRTAYSSTMKKGYNVLQLIEAIIDLVRDHSQQEGEKKKEGSLTKIADTARALQNSMNDILEPHSQC